MKAVYLKELRNYFTTPLGYVFMAFMLVIFGIYFVMYCMVYQYVDYSLVLNGVTMLVLFSIPILTMRIFSEEMRNKTDQLLLTAPIKTWKIVVGKYLAAMTLFTGALLITISQPLTLVGMGASLPTEKIIGGYIGFELYGCAFVALGILISSLTDNQLVAALASIGFFMLIFMLDGIAQVLPQTFLFGMIATIVVILVLMAVVYRAIRHLPITLIVTVILVGAAVALYFFYPSFYDGLLVRVSEWISLVTRYADFYTGVFDFSNVVYYISFTVLTVFLTSQIIEKRRWS